MDLPNLDISNEMVEATNVRVFQFWKCSQKMELVTKKSTKYNHIERNPGIKPIIFPEWVIYVMWWKK